MPPPAPSTTRRLHVIDQASPPAHGTVYAHLADLGQPVLLLGDRAMEAGARGIGLTHVARLSLSRTTPPLLAARRLRHALARLGRPTDLHAWSPRSLALLRHAADPAARLSLHLLEVPPRDTMTRLRRRWGGAQRSLFLHTFDHATRRRLVDAGFAADRVVVDPPPAHLGAVRLPRGVAERDAARAMLRERWEVDGTMCVIVPLCDPPQALHTPAAIMTINFAAMASGREMRLLVHPDQSGRQRAQAVLDRLTLRGRLIQEPWLDTPWRVLPGCDVAVCSAAPAPLAAAYALALRLPVVAPDLPHHREAFGDAGHVHFAPTADPKKLSDRLQHHALGYEGVRMA